MFTFAGGNSIAFPILYSIAMLIVVDTLLFIFLVMMMIFKALTLYVTEKMRKGMRYAVHVLTNHLFGCVHSQHPHCIMIHCIIPHGKI